MNKINDNSGDKKYFTQIPQLVWAKCRDVYDLSLWHTIKMVAGEAGECYLSTEDLALLSMMSTGKASQCRKYLIEQGILAGEIRRDPGYPQPVWHLTIPDVWRENVEWREMYESLAARIELKERQKSLHQMKPSPDEGGPSPDEGGPSPDETKKNQTNNQKEYLGSNSQKLFGNDPLTDIFLGQDQTSETTAPNPDDQWLNSKDPFVAAFEQIAERSPNQTEKQLILDLAVNGNLELWQKSLRATMLGWSGKGKPPATRMVSVYKAGGDYKKGVALEYPPGGEETWQPKDRTPEEIEALKKGDYNIL